MSWIAIGDGTLRPTESPASSRSLLLSLTAACSLVAALAHGWVFRSHLVHWWGYGAFFAGVAVAQAVYVVAISARPTRRIVTAGIAGNLSLLGLYVWSRTVGVPFGPHAGQAETLGVPDLIAGGAETALILILPFLYPVKIARRLPRSGAALIASVLAAAGVLGPAGHGHGPVPSVSIAPVILAAFPPSPVAPGDAAPAEEAAPQPEACIVKAASGFRAPAAAPPGSARAVVYTRASNVWIYEPRSDNTTRLSDNGENCSASDPTFRDESRVTFSMDSAIFQIALTTGDLTEVVREAGWISMHAWDPRGETLAYLTSGSDGEPRDRLVLYRPSDGTRQVLRTFEGGGGRCGSWDDEASMFWSPDGRALLLQITHLPFGTETLFVLTTSGTNLVAPRAGTHARWAPDSQTIYYREFEGDRRWFALRTDTGARSSLGIPPATHHVAVSPDGTRIAYVEGDENPSVFVYDLAARRRERIIDGAAAPLWLDPESIMLTDTEPCEGECHGSWQFGESTLAVDSETHERTRLSATSSIEARASYEPLPEPTPAPSPSTDVTPVPTPTASPTETPNPEPTDPSTGEPSPLSTPEPSETASPTPSSEPTPLPTPSSS